jgi:hypothetical protein
MRVAMLSSISWRTPPRAYGPWELTTSLLTEALVERGVDVTLFATLDSITAGKLDGVVPTGYSEDPSLNPKVWEALHIAQPVADLCRDHPSWHPDRPIPLQP